MNHVRLLLALSAVTLQSACAIKARANATRPNPNVLVDQRLGAKITLDTSEVAAARICSHTENLADVCVDGFREAFDQGLTDLLNRFYGSSADAPSLTGKFRLVEFSHSPVHMGGRQGSVGLSLKWQFQLIDSQGRALFQLAENTDGPKLITSFDGDPSVQALVEATLERLAKELNARTRVAGTGLETVPEDAPGAIASSAVTTRRCTASQLPEWRGASAQEKKALIAKCR
jgi:hypothetical protein